MPDQAVQDLPVRQCSRYWPAQKTMSDPRLIPPKPLRRFVHQIFQSMGADEDAAGEASSHLIRSNLSGHDSHGVMRMKQYAHQFDSGVLVPSARPVVVCETAVTALIDAQRGIGQYSTAFALEWAMSHAKENGIAVATIRHSTHIGRLGEYSERAAEKGFVTMITAGAAGLGVGGMAPWGGRDRFLAPSPWAFGVPAAGRAPVVFDAAMTTVAQGKVRVAHDKGEQLPLDCITGPEGKPSTNPPDFYAGGTLVPLGGQVAGHKGSGLALVAALLGGLGMIDDPEPSLIGAAIQDGSADDRGRISGVFLVVVDPSCFGDAERYQAMVAETLLVMKDVAPANAAAEILAPGEWELRNRRVRGRAGIPLPELTCRELAEIGARFGVRVPKALTRPDGGGIQSV